MNDENCPETAVPSEASSAPSSSDADHTAFSVSPSLLPNVLLESGRFEVRRLLGRGGFGEVFLAHDRQLSRMVALKVPRGGRFSSPSEYDEFLKEAQAAASLRHPGIVVVHDVLGDSKGVFIVFEFIEGSNLSELAAHDRLPLKEVVRLMMQVAHAIGYAHERGIVHRDLKPSNIMVDSRRNIRVTDFGLAVHARFQRSLPREVTGTPQFMAPEQVRGETHRLDGRTDIWSLGVIFYWLLTRRLPFDGARQSDIFDEVLNSEPRPPRQFATEIPREIERICLKALAKRMSERYLTAQDLAEDLQHWCEHAEGDLDTANKLTPRNAESSATAPLTVIPKGLRSFDRHDADFFLSLLPGPYDRRGVPESVRFWKQRIEERDANATFAVGLLYGPSGCGKTSLLQAGVVPLLTHGVKCIYVECTPEHTEERIFEALARIFPDAPNQFDLADVLHGVRNGVAMAPDEKVLIVLDQFEQWLNGRDFDLNEPLVRALRHCDGGRLQCLVMVRDDFCMAATRFMNVLETPILEGQNCAAMDAFRPEHARRVLRKFGEAYDRFGGPGGDDGDRFVTQAVEMLCEGNSVAPVRLAAFAELMRFEEWTPQALRRYSGSGGLGVALLDACLGEDGTNLTLRNHRAAAQRMLQALMPVDRTSLKGQRRTHSELLAASRYVDRPADFELVLHLLDKELRLISPADQRQDDIENSTGEDVAPARTERTYQLAHDFLVPSLNAWLTKKLRATRAGRASLQLESMSVDWNLKPDARRLPSLMEWAALRIWTRPAAWTVSQRRMMVAAERRYVLRLVALAVGLVIGLVAIFQWQQRQQRVALDRHGRSLADQLLVADVNRIPSLLVELDKLDTPAVRQALEAVSASAQRSNDERLRAQLFLAPEPAAKNQELIGELLGREPAMHRVITARLAPGAASLRDQLWQEIDNSNSDDRLLRAAAALAAWDAGNEHWADKGARVADALARCANQFELTAWVEALEPVKRHFTARLSERFRVVTAPSTERATLSAVLSRFLAADSEQLADLIADAGRESFASFFHELQRQPVTATAALRQVLKRNPVVDGDPLERDIAVRRCAVVAIALARLDESTAFVDALSGKLSPDVRTAVIDRCAQLGYPPEDLVAWIDASDDDQVRQACLLALAEYNDRLTPEMTSALERLCLRLWQHDPHHGVHGGAEYLLRKLGRQQALTEMGSRPVNGLSDGLSWCVNSQGMALVCLRGSKEFTMGSAPGEPDREEFEFQRTVRLEHSFAIGAHEVTLREFQRFLSDFSYARAATTSDDCPASNISWYDAAKYCRWLSQQEGIDESQMCYPSLDQIGPDMLFPADWQSRTGYRLPTEAEWEFACRAGTRTARFFGENGAPMTRYAIFNANSGDMLRPVGSLRPNPWGLFDVYGGVLEWCQDTPLRHSIDIPPGEVNSYRALRSGSYRTVERENRSARQFRYQAGTRFAFLGFRVARTIDD